MKSALPSQLESILSDIRRAIDAKLYYPALLVALTIPDICSALELDDTVYVTSKHYIAFVDQYTKGLSLGLSGVECFRLRGGVVHRGNAAGHDRFGTSHVIFSIPESQNSIHGLTLEDFNSGKNAAMFDLKTFCEAMIRAAELWFDEHKNEALVAKNIGRLLSMRANGVPPFFGGTPVVASGEDGYGQSMINSPSGS